MWSSSIRSAYVVMICDILRFSGMSTVVILVPRCQGLYGSASRPAARIVAVSSAPPARETTPLPAPSARTRGYDPLRLPTWKVLLELAATGPSPGPILPGQEHLFTPGSIRDQPGWTGRASERGPNGPSTGPSAPAQGPSPAHLVRGLDISRSVRQS